jgi:nitroreductase
MANGPSVTGKPAGVIKLPEPCLDSQTSIELASRRRRSVREFDKKPLALPELSQLLWDVQGLTGPEGKHTASSAGTLYPLEVFVVAGKAGGLPAGVYRSRPDGHDLLLIAQGDQRAKLATAALGQDWLADAPVTIVLAAVYERTARKYRHWIGFLRLDQA